MVSSGMQTFSTSRALKFLSDMSFVEPFTDGTSLRNTSRADMAFRHPAPVILTRPPGVLGQSTGNMRNRYRQMTRKTEPDQLEISKIQN